MQHAGLGQVVAAHLSAQNNVPSLAQETLAAALDWMAEDIIVASPTQGTDWLRVDARCHGG